LPADRHGALDHYRRALRTNEQLAAADPDNVQYQHADRALDHYRRSLEQLLVVS